MTDNLLLAGNYLAYSGPGSPLSSMGALDASDPSLVESPHSTEGHCIAARECPFDATERLIATTVQGFVRVRGL